MMCPAMALDKVIHVQPETFDLPMKDGENYIKITPPCAHSGPAPVHTRIISARLREGQVRRNNASLIKHTVFTLSMAPGSNTNFEGMPHLEVTKYPISCPYLIQFT